MPPVRWTDLAEQQLLQIRTRKLGEAVLAAAEGLVRFPRLGRPIPEQERFPQLAGVRDFTVKETVRVLYEYDQRRDRIWILGLLFPGQKFTPRRLGWPEA